jgi:hypothetical protein
MKIYNSYILITIIVKVIYSISYSTHLYFALIDKKQLGSLIDEYAILFRDISEIVFITLMSVLILFLFNPYMIINHSLYMNMQTKSLFFIFGIILLFVVCQMVLENELLYPSCNFSHKEFAQPSHL